MEALKLSFPKTISPAAPKAAVPTQQDQALFASLLASLNTEAELPSEEQPPAEQIMESLESLLTLLQEIPVEEQTVEQQELQYAILQLQELQTATAQVSTTPGQASGSLAEAADASAKLLELLENIQQKLHILSSTAAAQSTESSAGKEAATQTNNIYLADVPEISKQLDKLIDTLEKEVLAAQHAKSISQQLPVEGSRLVNDIPRFLSESLKPVKELPKVPLETQGKLQQTEAIELQPSVKLQGAEELQSQKVAPDNKPAQETTVQPAAGATAEAAKAAGSQIRTEASPPAAPFVRLSNLLEDLGGMLKSSMRMAETAEGMKMRVNIFPEHLGHLEILLTSTNGKLAAQIMASTPMAKEALELQLNQLRASLSQQGVAVEKIEVLQQSSQQPFGQQQSPTEQQFSRQSRNGAGKQEKNGYFQPEEEKTAERQPSVGQLMKVDYTV